MSCCWTPPTNGTLTNNGGMLTYTPNDGFTGTDTFTYLAADNLRANSNNTATVTITVNPDDTNTPPVAGDRLQRR